MKSRFTSSIAFFSICSLLLTSCGSDTENTAKVVIPPKYVDTTVVKVAPLAEELKLVGRIAGSKESPVSSQVSGVIKTIAAQIGSRVKAGETLATIDFSSSTLGVSADAANSAYQNSLVSYEATQESAQKDIENARVSLDNAKTSRDNTYAVSERQLSIATLQRDNAKTSRDNTYASTNKQKQIAQTQLDNIDTTKDNSLSTTSESLKAASIAVDLAGQSVENAQNNLDNFEKTSTDSIKTLEDKLSGMYDASAATINSTFTSLDSAMNTADTILGLTDENKEANDSYEPFLSAKNLNAKTETERKFWAAHQIYADVLKGRNLDTREGIETSLNAIVSAISKTVVLYDGLTDVLNATQTTSNFTTTSLDTLKATVAAKQSIIVAANSTIVATKNSLTDTKNALAATKTSVETNRKTLQTALAIANTQLASAKQSYASLQSGNTSALDTVSGNQTLLKDQYESTLTSINTARDASDKALAIAEEQLASTKVSVKASKDSADNAVRSAQAQYDSTKARLASQIASTKSQVASAKGQKEATGVQFDNGFIKAPFDGIVTARNVEVGTLVSPGSALFVIGTDSSLKIKMDISSENASQLSVGQWVGIDHGGKSWHGSISAVSAGADSTTKLFRAEAVFDADTNIDDLKASLSMGDYVDVYVEKRTERSALLLPFSAVLPLGQETYQVYVVDGSGSIARAREVKLGAQNSRLVEVVSGLKENERVIVGGALNVQEGDKVQERTASGGAK